MLYRDNGKDMETTTLELHYSKVWMRVITIEGFVSFFLRFGGFRVCSFLAGSGVCVCVCVCVCVFLCWGGGGVVGLDFGLGVSNFCFSFHYLYMIPMIPVVAFSFPLSQYNPNILL